MYEFIDEGKKKAFYHLRKSLDLHSRKLRLKSYILLLRARAFCVSPICVIPAFVARMRAHEEEEHSRVERK